MINIIISIASLLLGAKWRRLDGEGGQIKFFHLAPLLWILPVAWYDHMLGLALLIAWVSLLDGFHGWTDFGYMSKRYTFYSLLACMFAGVSQWYILCGFISGICYPIGAWYTKKYNSDFKYTEYCEYIAGGLMFGGAFLQV